MKIIIILISLIFFLIINISAYSKSSENDFYQQSNKQPTKSGKIQSIENKNPSNSFVSSNIQDISNARNQKHQSTGEDEHHWYDKLLDFTITDFLMVIFNALLAFFSYRLWLTTRNLWRVSKEQADALKESVSITKGIAGATERSANAALSAANAAKRSAETLPAVERAYIFVTVEYQHDTYRNDNTFEPIHGVNGFQGNYLCKADVQLWNCGRTPAVITKIRAVISLEKAIIPEIEEVEIPLGIVIGSDKSKTIPVSIHINDMERKNIINWNTIAYCCGRIEYQDVFRGKYTRGFCWEYRLHSSRPTEPWVISNTYRELNYENKQN
jgi:hypothetical protein